MWQQKFSLILIQIITIPGRITLPVKGLELSLVFFGADLHSTDHLTFFFGSKKVSNERKMQRICKFHVTIFFYSFQLDYDFV